MSLALLDTANSFLYESPNHTGSPERMLLLAVLERAILDYVGNDRKEAATAEEWIFAPVEQPLPEVESGDPFTFVWVCRELDLNPTGVSEMIRSMPKRGTNRIAPWYFARKNEQQH